MPAGPAQYSHSAGGGTGAMPTGFNLYSSHYNKPAPSSIIREPPMTTTRLVRFSFFIFCVFSAVVRADPCDLQPCDDNDYTYGLEAAQPELWESLNGNVDGKPADELIKPSGELWSLLYAKRYKDIDAYFQNIHDLYRSGRIDEYFYVVAIDNGSWYARDVLPMLDAWIDATGSVFSRQSKGLSLQAVAWHIRGGKLASKTSPEQLLEFSEYLGQSVSYFESALDDMPDLVVSYRGLFKAAQGNDKYTDFMGAWVARMEEHVPGAFYPRAAIMELLEPRWGGSYRAMRAFAEDAQRYRDLNPRLRALLGYEWADWGRRLKSDNKYEQALAAYDRAIYHGVFTQWLLMRAFLYWNTENYPGMEADARTALSILPDLQRAQLYLAVSYQNQGKDQAADKQYALYTERYPQDASAWGRWAGMAFHAKTYPKAERLYRKAIEIDPTNIDYRYWYAMSIYRQSESKALSAFKDYLEVCAGLECEDEHFEEVEQWVHCHEQGKVRSGDKCA